MGEAGLDCCARLCGAALAGALWLVTARADATYSIVAVDLASGQAGGAGTSCVGSNLSVYEILGVAPGFGVMVAQAAVNFSARDRAVMLLEQGSDAPAVLADITSSGFDFLSAARQYGIVDAKGTAVGFTGGSTMEYSDDIQGTAGDFAYSVQGNILTGAAVLEQASAVFQAPGCDLADTLLLALEAGARNGQGDSRCTGDGIPSDGAFLHVELADGGSGQPFVHLQVDDSRPDDPLAQLRTLYGAWRADHPCPEPPTVPAPSDAGAADAGSAGASPPVPPPAPPPDVPAPPAPGAGGAPPVSPANPGATGGQGPLPPSTGNTSNASKSGSSGCGVVAARGSSGVTVGLLAAAALALCSRRKREGSLAHKK